MAATEVKAVTLYALLSSALGAVAAEYSMILAGAVIGGGIALSTGAQTAGVLASLRLFISGVGCALLFTVPLASLAEGMTLQWLHLPREELLGAMAGLIGIFWRQGLAAASDFGQRWAKKIGSAGGQTDSSNGPPQP